MPYSSLKLFHMYVHMYIRYLWVHLVSPLFVFEERSHGALAGARCSLTRRLLTEWTPTSPCAHGKSCYRQKKRERERGKEREETRSSSSRRPSLRSGSSEYHRSSGSCCRSSMRERRRFSMKQTCIMMPSCGARHTRHITHLYIHIFLNTGRVSGRACACLCCRICPLNLRIPIFPPTERSEGKWERKGGWKNWRKLNPSSRQ